MYDFSSSQVVICTDNLLIIKIMFRMYELLLIPFNIDGGVRTQF